MSRPSHSRQSSFSYIETPSRRSSISSNPNVFSDDYALEPIDFRPDLMRRDTNQSDFTLDHEHTQDTLNITPYPAIPARLSALARPNSMSKRAIGNDSSAASHDGATERTLSTSSRFSFVRSQSPYSGPTQPSHPYAMYPQITRASSIASSSTIRPQENPFIPTGGPEHPYSMFHQNTVPEDGDDDIGTQPIPLGFRHLGLPSSTSSGRSASDVGDIVGTDGHIEQLPPYTRYADNVIAKGDMGNFRDTSTLAGSRRASTRTTLVPTLTNTETQGSSNTEAQDSSEREILLNGEAKKENWKETARRRVCGGIALWLLVLIVVMVIFAGVIGGTVGAVVGRRQGTDLALQAGATTIYLDADPLASDRPYPACPTGRYNIPFGQSQEIGNCVVNSRQSRAWSCLDFAWLGITISEAVVDGSKSLQVTFDDYSVNTSMFQYGPQPPDFNGTSFDLQLAKDRDNKDLGVAMFFYKEFDKLSILPPWSIPTNGKRSIDARYVHERGFIHDGDPISIDDTPWFCFWNSTINEFWIFLEEAVTPISSFTDTSTITSAAADQAPTGATSSMPWMGISGPPAPTVTKLAAFDKRGQYSKQYLPQYPQLVKMIEKRKPSGNIQPYCQMMRVLPDWSIVPNINNEIVYIVESQFAQSPVNAGKRDHLRRGDSTTYELESNCVCEWMST